MTITVQLVDYQNKQQCADLVYLLDNYAQDPMGGAEPLSDFTKQNLTNKLQKLPTVFSLLCYVDAQPAGLINAIMGFSTFKCQPLINIHDLAVVQKFRGQGISQRLLSEVEQIAKTKDCCKITLEVLQGNTIARKAYQKFGFAGYELDPDMGKAMLWQKLL